MLADRRNIKRPVFRLFCELVLNKHSNTQNRVLLKTGFLSAFLISAGNGKKAKQLFWFFFRNVKKNIISVGEKEKA